VPAGDESPVVLAPLRGRALAAVVWAAWDTGEAVVPVDPLLTGPERDDLIGRLRPTHVHDGDGRRARPGGAPTAAGTAAIMVTSGTTGAPKGVELTRAGMEAMGRAYSAALGAGPGDRWLACLPLHHVATLGVLARAYVTGVPYTVHDTLDLDRVGRSPRAEGTTITAVVPTVLHRLLDAGAPLHEFRRVIVGGAPCPSALWDRAVAQGVRVVDAYGLTETWSGFAIDGRPIAGADVRLDRSGEILVRGPMVMRGYRLDDALTATVLTGDGWLRTGDVGTFTADGRLTVVDRIKDIIITGGVNVSPAEVETVLATHPGIADVGVVGVPDDEWGERVVAFVVATPGAAPPGVEELRDFARPQLRAAKLPREVRVVDVLPRSSGGKLLRRALRPPA
jgi:O-succinylbenzoic acid--CoA ligase